MEKVHAKTIRRSAANANAHEGSIGSFFGPAIQTKLTVNEPGDAYEQEADAVADQVMRKPSGSADPIASVLPMVSGIQRCDCDKEKMQRKETGEQDDNPIMTKLEHAGAIPSIQRFSIDCEKFKKSDDELDATDAAEETVAPEGSAEPPPDSGGGDDSGGGEPVQRKCAECEKKDLQREESGSEEVAPSASFESNLQASKGGGSGLPTESRSFFEDRFGADFSGVRVHNDDNSANLSRSINAHAFTHGQDIYFNSGQYNSGESGQKLLAHELTHVVQQSGGSVQRKKQSTPDIQRSFYFTPSRPRVSGSAVHAAVLPEFLTSNPNLFVEVSIPGANRKDVDKDKTGAADFYKGPRTIGIKFDTEPKELNADRDFKAASGTAIGGKDYRHKVHSAPKGSAFTPRVQFVDQASPTPEIGELKPAYSSETWAGGAQILSYITGITQTRDRVNTYLTANPSESNSTQKVWNVDPKTMEDLHVPDKLNYTMGQGISTMKSRPLDMWREGDKAPYAENVGFKGTLFVYKEISGVWSYEWIPDGNVPATTGSADANRILTRLNTKVIPELRNTGGQSAVAPKRAPTGFYVMRKETKFSDEAWKKAHYTPWRGEAIKFLGNKSEMKKAEVAQGIAEVDKRTVKGTGKEVNAPKEVKEQGRDLHKIKHWKRFGGFYGWLREKFDAVYVKVKGFVDKVRKKVDGFAKKSSGTAFGNWLKAFARVVFKIIKMVGSWAVNKILEEIMKSLQKGITNNVNKLIENLTPDEAKVHLAKFCEYKEKYDKILGEQEDALETMLFGDKLKLMEMVEEIEEKVSVVGDIVTLIEWGIRLLACASPPAIGCLWNLAIEALKWAFAALMQTCWFTNEVTAPIINKVDAVKEFPSTVAKDLVEKFNEVLPVPEGFDKWFADIDIHSSQFKKPDCNEANDGAWSLTGDRRAIWDSVKPKSNEPESPLSGELTTTGKNDEKLKAALQMMKNRGAGPWVLLTKERMAKLNAGLENTNPADMVKAAGDKKEPIPEGMKDMMTEVSTYTEKEKGLIDDARYAAAEKKEKEAIKKMWDEINKDPKAIAALAAPYPSYADLATDLDAFKSWGLVTTAGPRFAIVNGHTIVALKTSKGSRLGAYFKSFEKNIDGENWNVILETSDYFNLDAIEEFDNISMSGIGLLSNSLSLTRVMINRAFPARSLITGFGNYFALNAVQFKKK